jgi:hypothetical protein
MHMMNFFSILNYFFWVSLVWCFLTQVSDEDSRCGDGFSSVDMCSILLLLCLKYTSLGGALYRPLISSKAQIQPPPAPRSRCGTCVFCPDAPTRGSSPDFLEAKVHWNAGHLMGMAMIVVCAQRTHTDTLACNQ